MADVFFTHLGTACVLIEIDGLRILTDPIFDPPGLKYSFGFGTHSRRIDPVAMTPEQLGLVHVALVSHDQHADNLDETGKALLKTVPRVLTTRAAARRLPNATGLRAWETQTLTTPGGMEIRVTATPARHGPPLSLPFVGPVIGFVIEWPGQINGALYISGDTVLFEGLLEIGKRFRVGTAMLHLGGVGFPAFGNFRFTMDGAAGAKLATELKARVVVPIHYSGWTHFLEPRSKAAEAFTRADLPTRWLVPGERTAVGI